MPNTGEQPLYSVVSVLHVPAGEHTPIVRVDPMVLVEQGFYFLFYHSGVHARLRNHGDVADPTRLVEGVAKRAVGYVNGFFFIGGVITSGAGDKSAHEGDDHHADVCALLDG